MAATRRYEELIATAEELRPDVIIADAETPEGTAGIEFIHAAYRHPTLRGIPLVLLIPQKWDAPPEAEMTLRKPVSSEFLLRRTREVLARARDLRAQSGRIVENGHTLIERSQRLTSSAQPATPPESASASRACPQCSSELEWVERGTIGGTAYDYYRWCPQGCGLYCFNRDSEQWIKLA